MECASMRANREGAPVTEHESMTGTSGWWRRPDDMPPAKTDPGGIWSSLTVIQHRIIIRTMAGGAGYVANAIDRHEFEGALGTIAGNDSVALICETPEAALALITPLAELLGPQAGPSSPTDA